MNIEHIRISEAMSFNLEIQCKHRKKNTVNKELTTKGKVLTHIILNSYCLKTWKRHSGLQLVAEN
jgi:hypothetical protein